MIRFDKCNYKESKAIREFFNNQIVSRLVYECMYNSENNWNIDIDICGNNYYDINFYVDGQNENDVNLRLVVYVFEDLDKPNFYEITFSYIENYADISINPYKNKLHTHSLDLVLGCLNIISTKVNKSKKQ